MAVLAPAAADEWAALDVGRSDAILDLHQEVVRDCPSAPKAMARDFPKAMAGLARQLWLVHQCVRERRQAQLPQDDWPKAVDQMELLAAPAQKDAPQQASLALQSAPDVEWKSPQAQSLRVQ